MKCTDSSMAMLRAVLHSRLVLTKKTATPSASVPLQRPIASGLVSVHLEHRYSTRPFPQLRRFLTAGREWLLAGGRFECGGGRSGGCCRIVCTQPSPIGTTSMAGWRIRLVLIRRAYHHGFDASNTLFESSSQTRRSTCESCWVVQKQ